MYALNSRTYGETADQDMTYVGEGDIEKSTITPLVPTNSSTPLSSLVENSESCEDSSIEADDSFHKPIFTVFYAIAVIALFIYGAHFMTDENNAETGLMLPLSPPLNVLFFRTVSNWPSCIDRRHQFWRLFSHQLVHAGYMHVISNQFMLLIFGSFFECNQGATTMVIILQLSILGGCMGHAAVWPFRPLIGNSHGVYGLFGASLAEVIINADVKPLKHTVILLFIFITQIIVDIVGFLFWFNPQVGYSAHTAGFCSGLLLSLSLSSCDKKKSWKILLGLLSITIYTTTIVYLLHHYVSTWPSQSLISPTWSNLEMETCCEYAIQIQKESDITQDEVIELFYCNGNTLVEK